MAERTLLRDGMVLTCAGDPAERPSDGDVLIEGDRIVAVSPGRLDVDHGSVARRRPRRRHRAARA